MVYTQLPRPFNVLFEILFVFSFKFLGIAIEGKNASGCAEFISSDKYDFLDMGSSLDGQLSSVRTFCVILCVKHC